VFAIGVAVWSKYWNVVNRQSPMMDSGYGGQEELAPVAGLRDEFHQSGTALAERVPGGRESHP
jgi:hypothetical protein